MCCCCQQPHNFCEHCMRHLHVSPSSVSFLNQGGLARASSSIRTIVHKTYKRMLIQNSRTSTPTWSQKIQHHFSTPTTMSGAKTTTMSMKITKQPSHHSNNNLQRPHGGMVKPPTVVETVVSSGQSQTSSIGIGEFGMNPAHRENAATFSMAVKDNLFPTNLLFLQGTNASLDFSMDTTSICWFLHLCCGVAEADAYQWWADHSSMLKNIHTDIRNNKIKMIKQQFNGKIISFALILQDETSITTTTAHIFVDNKLGFRKISLKPQRSCNVHSCINAST